MLPWVRGYGANDLPRKQVTSVTKGVINWLAEVEQAASVDPGVSDLGASTMISIVREYPQ